MPENLASEDQVPEAVRCHYCDSLTPRYSSREYDDNHYCPACYNTNFSTCDSCGCTNLRSQLNSLGHRWYCSTCFHDARLSNVINGYHRQPEEFRFYNMGEKVNPIMHYGIELEFEFENSNTNFENLEILCKVKEEQENRFFFENDGSLRNGAELITHPMSKKYFENWSGLDDTCNTLRLSGFRSFDTRTCGLHIHTSRDAWESAELTKIALFWYSHTRLMRILCQRENNNYCHSKNIPDKLSDIKESQDRYEAINFTRNDTVEFRQFKGTLNPQRIRSYVEVIESLRSYVKKIRMGVIMNLEDKDYIEFVLENKKSYPNLAAFLGESVER